MLKLVGGYKIVDLKGANLTNVAINMPGIYSSIESSNKAILLQNFKTSGTERKPLFAFPFATGNSYIFFITSTADTLYKLRVDDSDRIFFEPVNYTVSATEVK